MLIKDCQERPQRTDASKGFTLIELLVVIAIISILAAMLLPGLAKSKGEAQSIVCKNHLHQMAEAMQMYVQDYQAYPSTDSGPTDWPVTLEPYYPLQWTNQNYQCPAYIGVCVAEPEETYAGSYGYNATGGTEGYGLGRAPDGGPQKESQVVAPSEMYAMMDSRGQSTTSLGIYYTRPQWWGCIFAYSEPLSDANPFSMQSPPQHGSFFNVAFCDTHVAPVRIDDLFNLALAMYWNCSHQTLPP
jgi:prepilin-type N-terminal cleavage/methylation domain-containing protein/prepilin-type processing-associated H-X9-DG protein